jgi:hypothetical protein
MANYQLTTGTYITRTADGASIPADPLNADYRVYLAWVAAGNTPDPAPPAPAPPSTTVMPTSVFLTRFTSAEQAAIVAASQTNPAIMIILLKAAADGTIDVASPAASAALAVFVAAGAIPAARVPVLLAPP